MEESKDHIVKHPDQLSFILGGNALFTIRLRDGKRFTYKVQQDYRIENRFRVKTLYGPDNNSNYKEFGDIIVQNGVPLFHKYSIHEYPHVLLFDMIFLNLCIGLETPGVEFFHSGRCCRCGRILTVPESIMSGIGPECAFKVSILKSLLNGPQ